MEERVYTIEAEMQFKERIEAYSGPGRLTYVDFDMNGLPPRPEVECPIERIHVVFSGTSDDHGAFREYLRELGLIPRGETKQNTVDEFNPFDPKTYPKL